MGGKPKETDKSICEASSKMLAKLTATGEAKAEKRDGDYGTIAIANAVLKEFTVIGYEGKAKLVEFEAKGRAKETASDETDKAVLDKAIESHVWNKDFLESVS